jgi:hypothetical protein
MGRAELQNCKRAREHQQTCNSKLAATPNRLVVESSLELSFLSYQRDVSPRAETRGMAVFTDSRCRVVDNLSAVEWVRLFSTARGICGTANINAIERL